jgi:hypothetical protein
VTYHISNRAILMLTRRSTINFVPQVPEVQNSGCVFLVMLYESLIKRLLDLENLTNVYDIKETLSKYHEVTKHFGLRTFRH